MKQILIIEDNNQKLEKLKSFIKSEFPEITIVEKLSYNSACKEIVLNNSQYDLVLLDMSMQTYDVSEEETGGDPEPLAGSKILRQMYLRDIMVKVVVVTMYENFVDGTRLKQLNENLEKEYHDIYCGYIYFSHSNNRWQAELKNYINKLL